MARRLRALRVLHPFPSFLNATLVAVLAYLAAPDPSRAATLAIGMLGMQFAIGAVNDLMDRDADAQAKPWKPIPAGAISTRGATVLAATSAAAGLAFAALIGPLALVLWLAMFACGLAYDVRLKPTAWAWACFSIAFAILPIYAWHGASGELPPQWQLVVTLAFMAGPALALANGLADLEADLGADVRTVAVRLGRRRALVLMALLLATIYGLAWSTLAPVATDAGRLMVGLGALGGASGYLLSAGAAVTTRRLGWSLQAVSIAFLAAAWLLVAR